MSNHQQLLSFQTHLQSTKIQMRTMIDRYELCEPIDSLHYSLMEKLILLRSAHTCAITGTHINMLDTVIII